MNPANQFPIDDPTFSFSELLEITTQERGAAEGYMRRGIVVPSGSETKGKGNHRGYSGRDVLKFAAVATMGRAGVAPEWVKDFVASEVIANFNTGEMRKGALDRVIDDYIEKGNKSAYRKQSPFVFNAVMAPGNYDPELVVHKTLMGIQNAMQMFDDIKQMGPGLRKYDTVSYICFDAWAFVVRSFEILQNYIDWREAGKP